MVSAEKCFSLTMLDIEPLEIAPLTYIKKVNEGLTFCLSEDTVVTYVLPLDTNNGLNQ